MVIHIVVIRLVTLYFSPVVGYQHFYGICCLLFSGFSLVSLAQNSVSIFRVKGTANHMFTINRDKSHMNLDWWFTFCMQEANNICHHYNDLTFQFCSYCYCFIHSCIHSLDSRLVVTASMLTLVLRLVQLLWAVVAVTRSILIPVQHFSMIIPLIYSCTLYLFVPDFQNDSCKNCNKTTHLCFVYMRVHMQLVSLTADYQSKYTVSFPWTFSH